MKFKKKRPLKKKPKLSLKKKSIKPVRRILKASKKKKPFKKAQPPKRTKKVFKKAKSKVIRTIKSKVKKPKKIIVKKSKPVMAKSTSVRRSVSAKTAKKALEKNLDFSPKNFFKARIKVIGIGGGGGSIVSEIGRSLDKATFVIADTDVRAFSKKRKGIKYFLFGREMTHGLGTGLNPELAKAAAQKEHEKIAGLFENQDIVILIASLGGGVGSGATQIFAEASKEFDGITFGIFTLPFKFEGRNKYKISSKALGELRQFLNVSITIPNERIFKIIDTNTSITEAFSMVNKNLINSLESLIDLIYNPGIINIDFADLRAILRGKGNLAFLNTSEALGKDSSETVIKEILHNPLYQNNNFTAEKILFNITGGNNLSMIEVDKISRSIAEQNPKAKIIFGISKNAKYKNKIKTTLLMTGPSLGQEIKPEMIIGEAPVKEEPNKSKKLKRKSKPKKDKQLSQQGERMITMENINSVFDDAGAMVKQISINETSSQPKKAIRRSALDIKKAEELEENRKTQQEKEWEIPAFLRKIKFKP